MYNYIWGNVFIYCREHNIEFSDVCKALLEECYGAYSNENDKMLKIFGKTVYSTLEMDINVLTEKFHIPLKDILFQENYQDKVVQMIKEVIDYWCEYNFYHSDHNIQFKAVYEANYFEYIDYIFVKYFNKEDMTFHYNVSVEFWPWYSYDKRPEVCESEKKYIGKLLNDYYYYSGDGICLYDGKNGVIAEYFEKMAEYQPFNDCCQYNDADEPIEVWSKDYKIIDFKNIVVKSAVKKCDNENHHISLIKGLIFILLHKSDEIKIKIVPLVYCKECNSYYMYEYEYNALCMEGRPLCRIYNNAHRSAYGDGFNHLSTESIFKICGYSVDANEDLSEKARHNLLDFLIKRNIVTAVQTLNFLQWLINSRRSNPNMYNALRKWENDFEYIGQTYSEQGDKVIFTPE